MFSFFIPKRFLFLSSGPSFPSFPEVVYTHILYSRVRGSVDVDPVFPPLFESPFASPPMFDGLIPFLSGVAFSPPLFCPEFSVWIQLFLFRFPYKFNPHIY